MPAVDRVPVWLARDAEKSAAWRGWQDGMHEVFFGMLVEADGHLFMGKPVRIEITWPEGLPHGFTEETLRAWAAEELARLRAKAAKL